MGLRVQARPGMTSEMTVPQTDSVNGAGSSCSNHQWTAMEYYAGVDVSLECSNVCGVDATGRMNGEISVALMT